MVSEVSAQGKHWLFTVNNYTPAQVAHIRLLREREDVIYLCYGYEEGQSGTPHLQGFVSFAKKKRFHPVKALLACGNSPYIERARGSPKINRDYCRKGTQSHEEWNTQGVEGPNFGIGANFEEFGELPGGQGKRSDWDAFREWVDGLDSRPSHRELVSEFPKLFAQYGERLWTVVDALLPVIQFTEEDVALRDWQEDLVQEWEEPADPRKVTFVVDTVGDKGKSWLCRYALSHIPRVQVLKPAKRDDVAAAVDESNRIFLFDVGRNQMEHFQYSIVEMLKDMMVFSPKYNSRMKTLRRVPHVVVFCNEHPDMDAISSDRYDIKELN